MLLGPLLLVLSVTSALPIFFYQCPDCQPTALKIYRGPLIRMSSVCGGCLDYLKVKLRSRSLEFEWRVVKNSCCTSAGVPAC